LQVETLSFQIAPSLQSANTTQSYSGHVTTFRSPGRLRHTSACLDYTVSNSNFAVFTESKFTGTPK